jgi:hypothetical protein
VELGVCGADGGEGVGGRITLVDVDVCWEDDDDTVVGHMLLDPGDGLCPGKLARFDHSGNRDSETIMKIDKPTLGRDGCWFIMKRQSES